MSDHEPPQRNDLERCHGDGERLLQRLQTILEHATGRSGSIYKGAVSMPWKEPFSPGAHVKFPPGRVESLQRVGLWADGENICVAGWPCELAPQYQRVYNNPDAVEALIALGDQPGWELRPGFHLAYRFAAPPQRWYPRRHLSGPQYVRQWVQDVRAQRAGARYRAQLQDNSFHQWLAERRYADGDDLASLDDWVTARPPRTQFHIRPSVRIMRTWPMTDAISGDRTGAFTTDVRDAVDRILTAVGEPTLKAIEP